MASTEYFVQKQEKGCSILCKSRGAVFCAKAREGVQYFPTTEDSEEEGRHCTCQDISYSSKYTKSTVL